MSERTGVREADGHCSLHGASYIHVYDDHAVTFDCAICHDFETLEKKVSQLIAAFENLAAVCQERLNLGETTVALESVRRYAERYIT